MRFGRQLQLLALLAASATLTAANPFPRDSLHDAGYSYLMPRDCASYCGSDNQYCCGSGESCQTVGAKATCVAGDAVAGAVVTTWTVTHTYTSTMATYWDVAPEPTAGVDCVPKNKQQEACGSICCAGWQTCAYKGQCSAKPGFGGGKTVVVTSGGKVTTQYSAPYRVTGTTVVTGSGAKSTKGAGASDTLTGTAATATASSGADTIGAAGDTHSGGSHLSGGAIAGIVVGTLAGVALLLLLCFCCIARGIWTAIFGKKEHHDRERVDVYEERYSRHGSRHGSRPPPSTAHARRDRHKGWFGFGGGGGGGAPSSADSRREKKSSGAKWLGIAGLAATLLALLNLRKDKRPASSKPARSSRGSSRGYSDSYYSYSDYTSPSSSNSGGRSHRTGQTRRTRDSRARSYYSHSERR